MFKVVFALTTEGNDFYSAMTRVAVASLRLSNPGLQIVVACDRESDISTRRAGDPLIGEVDVWFAIDTPAGESGFRNRYMKTSLRGLIDGPFLFLDSDILVRSDLRDILALDADIAAAPNHSKDTLGGQIWVHDAETLKSMKWATRSDVYVNGGVMFYNDTLGARQFASCWHELWKSSYEKCGSYRDQPALNTAIFKSKAELNILPHRFNSQIRTDMRKLSDAVIWHFYSSVTENALTAFDSLVTRLLKGEELNRSEIRSMIARHHPWRCDYWIDNWVGDRLTKRGEIGGWETVWLGGNRLKALKKLVQ